MHERNDMDIWNRTKNTVKTVDPSQGYIPRPEFMGEEKVSE
jgi:hypothetical protein